MAFTKETSEEITIIRHAVLLKKDSEKGSGPENRTKELIWWLPIARLHTGFNKYVNGSIPATFSEGKIDRRNNGICRK